MNIDDLEEQELARALQPMHQALAADGYALKVEVSEEVVLVTIEAGDEACAVCLIPKDLMDAMIHSSLESEGFAMEGRTLHLLYPSEP
ncbi:MAG TPA: hypothetical protein VKA15_19380 [Isosphaeraceae bacterium]|nr:hypothetical protein [Isosphaeraceae bacterium]